MKTITKIPDVFSCAAAPLDDGWICAGLAVTDIDAQFVSNSGQAVSLLEGRTQEQWMTAFAALKRRLVCTMRLGRRTTSIELAAADRIAGLAVVGGVRPAVVWCQKQGGRWQLMLWDGQQSRVLVEQVGQLSEPAVVRLKTGLLIACQYQHKSAKVGLWDDQGNKLNEFDGRRPVLAAATSTAAALLMERVNSPDSTGLFLYRLSGGRAGSAVAVPPASDFNINAATTAGRDGTIYVVNEACCGWGLDNRLGRHRDICLWTLPPRGGKFQPARGTHDGIVPLPKDAHWDMTAHNMPPVLPRITLVAGRPVVTYRRIECAASRSFGWHLWQTHLDGEAWSAPARITRHLGLGDAPYEVLAQGKELLVFAPSCDARPAMTLEEDAAGESAGKKADFNRRANNHRVEVIATGLDESLPAQKIPASKRAMYVLPPRLGNVCPSPAPLEAAPAGMQLVWGDLHPHSAYSKCMAADDGFPLDNLRYLRDVLGCKVLCLVEHTTLLSCTEFTHVYDRLELEAGDDCAVIYGGEPGSQPAHHINIYAGDRETFDRLREISFLFHQEKEVFGQIKRHFGPLGVLPVRHCHGQVNNEFGIRSPRTVELYDREVEVAMEAMQLRGDMMVELAWRVSGMPIFPNNFLNAGARIGLVGGTDHSNPPGPNSFCLTGFWVNELSSQAVMDAIRQRRTIACSNAKIAIYAELDGQPMGREVAVRGPVRIKAHLSAGTDLRRVCLMRDGQLLAWQELTGRAATVELVDAEVAPGYHWYVVTAQAKSVVARQLATAHASPFFVTVQ